MRVLEKQGSFVLATALALSGCAPNNQWGGSIEVRNGVTYVSNPARGLWQGRDPEPIRFELEQSFGVESEPAGETIGSFGYQNVAVDGQGNVYLYDYTASQLVSFAPDGSLRWRGGRSGQAPGEFAGAQGIAWDGASGIYLTNASLTRLDHWSTDGEFRSAQSLLDRGWLAGTVLGFVDQGALVLQGRLPRIGDRERAGGVFQIVKLPSEFRRTDGARVEVDVGSSVLRFSGFSIGMAVTGGYITVGDFDNYEFRIFSREGDLERVVVRDFDRMVGYPVTDVPSSPYSVLSAPLRAPSGHWLVGARWVDTDDPAADYARRKASGALALGDAMRTSLDLFDSAGRFLYSLQSVPGGTVIGRLETFGPDGALYTSVREPFPQLRRYRVQIHAGGSFR